MRVVEKLISQQSASSRPVFSMNKSSGLGAARPLLGIRSQKGTSLSSPLVKSISREGVEEDCSRQCSTETKDDKTSREQYTLDGIENQNILLKSEEDVIHLHAVKNSVIVMYVFDIFDAFDAFDAFIA